MSDKIVEFNGQVIWSRVHTTHRETLEKIPLKCVLLPVDIELKVGERYHITVTDEHLCPVCGVPQDSTGTRRYGMTKALTIDDVERLVSEHFVAVSAWKSRDDPRTRMEKEAALDVARDALVDTMMELYNRNVKLELRFDVLCAALDERGCAGIISELARIENERNDFEDQVKELKERVKDHECC